MEEINTELNKTAREIIWIVLDLEAHRRFLRKRKKRAKDTFYYIWGTNPQGFIKDYKKYKEQIEEKLKIYHYLPKRKEEREKFINKINFKSFLKELGKQNPARYKTFYNEMRNLETRKTKILEIKREGRKIKDVDVTQEGLWIYSGLM